MRDVLDLHTHTLASGHAYSTINEMIQAAKDKGLKMLGITEHAPEMPGSCSSMYFVNFRVLPRERDGLTVLFGAELNIVDYEGHVDLPEEMLRGLDLVIASLHTPCIRPGTREENTRAYLKAMENPCLNIIGHPDDARYPIEYRPIVERAKERGILLEVNNSSLKPGSFRGDPRGGISGNAGSVQGVQAAGCHRFRCPCGCFGWRSCVRLENDRGIGFSGGADCKYFGG